MNRACVALNIFVDFAKEFIYMVFGYKITEQNAIHFVTFTVVKWVDLFTRPIYKNVLIDALRFYQEKRGLVIYSFVVMTNHMHLIVQTPENNLSDFIRDYKRWTSRKFRELMELDGESRRNWMKPIFEIEGQKNPRNNDYQFWIQDNRPMVIFGQKFAKQKLNYIHQNPVKAGIVINPEDYIYSSASNYAGMGGLLKIRFIDELGGEG